MKLALTSGFYQARSLIASAQKCQNQYAEKNAPDAPFPYTFYDRAGLSPLVAATTFGGRCAYTASNGDFFEVVGPNVYFTNAMWQRTFLGSLPLRLTPVSMIDNGLVVLIVDGSSSGWCIDLTTHAFAQVTGQAGAFFGSVRVDEMDTFFLLSGPGTNVWYISLSEVTFENLTGTVTPNTTAAAFDPLDIAAKTGNPDPISALIVMHREAWLLGVDTSEVWYDAGSADFAFGELPGVFIEHGCCAPYSIAKQDLSVYWLSQDRQGQGMVMVGSEYAARRISTHAIEQQIQNYATISDAVGFTYQQLGHVFYVLTFPTADATWVYDVAEDLWSEWVWTDTNGGEHRHRAANAAFAYGENVCQDWETGALYRFDLSNSTDAGAPIVRRRGFPMLVNENKRVAYSRLILDVDVGQIANTPWSYPGAVTDELLGDDGQPTLDDQGQPIIGGWSLGTGSPAYGLPLGPQINLRYSDDRGHTWSNPRMAQIGATGQFDRSVLFTRLGMARNRVFEAFWDCDCFVALNGGYAEVEAAET